MRKLTYLAAPYSHPDPEIRECRFRYINEIAAKLMSRGELIFSPISHTHPICVDGNLPVGFDFWEKYDRAVLECCSCMKVLMLPGWLESSGIKREMEICRELGIPTFFLDEFGEWPDKDSVVRGVPN